MVFGTCAPTATLPLLDGLDQIQFRLDQVSVTLLACPFRHRFPHSSWQSMAVADARDEAIRKACGMGAPWRATMCTGMRF